MNRPYGSTLVPEEVREARTIAYSRRQPRHPPIRPTQRSFDTWPDDHSKSRRLVKQALETLNDPNRKHGTLQALHRELESHQRDLASQQRELTIKTNEIQDLTYIIDEAIRRIRADKNVGSIQQQLLLRATSPISPPMSHSHSTTELDTVPVASTPPTSISRHGGALGVVMDKSKRHRSWSRAKLTNLMHLFNRSNPPSTEGHGGGGATDTSHHHHPHIHARTMSHEDYRIQTAPRMGASLDSIALRMDLQPPPTLAVDGHASVSAARGSTVSDRRKTTMSVDMHKALPRVPRFDGTDPGPDDGFIFNLRASCRPDLRPSSNASVVVKVCRLPKIYRGALLEKFDVVGTTSLSEVLEGVNDRSRVAQTIQFDLRKFFMRTHIIPPNLQRLDESLDITAAEHAKWTAYVLPSVRDVIIVQIQSDKGRRIQWGFVPWDPATTISTLKVQVATMAGVGSSDKALCTLKGTPLEDWETYRDSGIKPGSYGLCVDL